MNIDTAPTARTYVGWAVTAFGALLVLAAIVLALWNLVLRLAEGIWPFYPATALLSDLYIPYPALPWPWLQGVFDWILGWSAAGVLTCFGIALVFLAMFLTAEHDGRLAAAKARDKAKAASDAEWAARYSPGTDAGEQDGPEPDAPEAPDAAEAPEAPEAAAAKAAPPHKVSSGNSIVEGLQSLGCVAVFLAVIVGAYMAWDAFSRTRYDQVVAQVRTVETNCELEWDARRNPEIWEKSGPRRSNEMSCAEARTRTRGYPRVIEVRTVTYTYASPADGRTYPGTLRLDAREFPPDVHAGGVMNVHVLRSDPSRSRRFID